MNKEKREKEKELEKEKDKEKGESNQEKEKKSQGILPKWFHWILSSFLLFGSAYSFYWLMKNKNKYKI